MREYIKNLNDYIESGGRRPLHGHCGQVEDCVVYIEKLCSLMEEGDILEVGFNAGHSSAMFLENTNKNVISFDICEEKNIVEVGKEYIDMTYPGRHSLVVGDSRETLPKFELKGDISAILVDGAHSYEMARTDLDNAINILNRGTMVIMDDVTSMKLGYAYGPTKAWDEAVNAGVVLEVERCEFERNRGLAWGYAL